MSAFGISVSGNLTLGLDEDSEGFIVMTLGLDEDSVGFIVMTVTSGSDSTVSLQSTSSGPPPSVSSLKSITALTLVHFTLVSFFPGFVIAGFTVTVGSGEVETGDSSQSSSSSVLMK